jgi:SAM-dependent methyltransferase
LQAPRQESIFQWYNTPNIQRGIRSRSKNHVVDNPASAGSAGFFDSSYAERPPWDIGEPQPALLALLAGFPPAGRVLDVGCGTGALALALAGRGLEMLGVDLSQVAIAQAQGRAAALPPNVAQRLEFRTGDALHPTLLPGPFGAVVDSGFFHLFGPEDRECFAHELAGALVEGGRYYLLGFAIASPMPGAPRQVLESELRTLFAPERGWRILALQPARFLIRSARAGEVPAIAACFERASPA